jgi:hypothetical protein
MVSAAAAATMSNLDPVLGFIGLASADGASG